MSKKARKRLNRFLRMSGRGIANANNARQHLASRTFSRDVAAGGEAQIAAAIDRERAAEEAGRVEAYRRYLEERGRALGVWG